MREDFSFPETIASRHITDWKVRLELTGKYDKNKTLREDNLLCYPELEDTGRMQGSPFPALLSSEEDVSHSCRSGDSSSSGQCSCSLLEVRGGIVSKLAAEGTGLWVLGGTQPLFPPSTQLPERPAAQPHASSYCMGQLCCLLLAAWGPGWCGKVLYWGTSAVWELLSLPCSPLAGPANTKCPWDIHYEHSFLGHHRLSGDIVVPQLPLFSRSSWRHSAPQRKAWFYTESSPISIFPGIYRCHIFYINI